jgi:hypothetical protein
VADFNDFQKQSYDIGCWSSYAQLMELAKDATGKELPAITQEFSGAYLHAYLHFENGEMRITGKVSPQSVMDAFYEKYPVIKKQFDHALLDAFPETTYFSIKLSVDLMAYLQLINATTASIDDPSIQMMLEDPTVKTLVNGLGGDMLFSIYGFAQGPLPLPLAGLVFTVNSEEDFNKILNMSPAGKPQQVGDHYVLPLGMGMMVYVAYKDNRVLLTDDAEAVTHFTGKGYSKTLKNSSLSENLKKNPEMIYLNLDLDSYPENIKTLLQKEAPQHVKAYIDLLKPYKDLSYGVNEKKELVISLRFKDSSQNSLKLLLQNLDDMACIRMGKQ